MKCKVCKGDGRVVHCYGGSVHYVTCPNCFGKGSIEPLTNDEWRKTCSAEDFAEFISAILDYGFGIDYAPRNPMGENVNDKEDIVEWLKENHDR